MKRTLIIAGGLFLGFVAISLWAVMDTRTQLGLIRMAFLIALGYGVVVAVRKLHRKFYSYSIQPTPKK